MSHTPLHAGQAGMNRNLFLCELGRHYLPAIPDLHARLHSNPPARVADIGCGLGWSSIGMALAYPNVQVDGFDLDEPSIEQAWANARTYGLTDRLTFHARDVGSLALLNGRYDLVTAFEWFHDLGNPVDVLRTMRRLAGEHGAVIVMDERVGMADTHPSAATGTVMRTDTLRQYAQEAGFQEVEVLPIASYFFRFYRLHG